MPDGNLQSFLSMRIEPYQICRSIDGWVPVMVLSDSTEGLRYRVLVCPWNSDRENICECPGYSFRGLCKHQKIAADSLCGWRELNTPHSRYYVAQTEDQRKLMVCPSCGGATEWKIDVMEDDDGDD